MYFIVVLVSNAKICLQVITGYDEHTFITHFRLGKEHTNKLVEGFARSEIFQNLIKSGKFFLVKITNNNYYIPKINFREQQMLHNA